MNNEVAVVSAARTPIGAYIGSLKEVPAYDLGAIVLNEAVNRAGIKPADVEFVVMAQAYQNGEYVNLARMSLLNAGWPVEIPGLTLDCRCCSGLEAISVAANKILTGNAEIVVASGAEHMSSAEFYIPGYIKWGVGGKKDAKWGLMPRGHGSLELWGLPFHDRIQRARVMSQPISRFGELNSMMSWAETAAKQEHITRQEADEWAVGSHKKAVAAIDSGKFAEEVVVVPIPQKKGDPVIMDVDETPRRDTSIEKLAKLGTVYPDGICTAGNSSSENDGAGAIVLMSVEKAKELGVKPLGYLKSCMMAGADPTLTYPAVPASANKALAKAGLTVEQMEVIEIQEAFACQALADARLMGLSDADMRAKVNVNGSGISLGHPVGATGIMRMTTLLYEMKRRNSKHGLATICGGGGQGITAIIERK
ncbi:thiolase family protein [Chloroflexota bacterium]